MHAMATTREEYAELAETLAHLLDAFPNALDDEDRHIFVALIRAVIRRITDQVEVAFPTAEMVTRLEELLQRVADVERACGAGSISN